MSTRSTVAALGNKNIILLSGGCFNPPTIMHLRIFEIARDFLHKNTPLKVIGGIISPTHDSYKKASLAEANGKHRSEMVKLSLQNNPWIKYSAMELDAPEWIRTYKVMQMYQEKINAAVKGGSPAPSWIPEELELAQSAKLMLLCGGDLLESFSVPGLWEENDVEGIIRDFGLVVISREGSNPENFIYKSDLLTKYRNNIHLVTEWIHNDISSTKIRRALRRGESVKYLLPDPVIQYIEQHKLYSQM